MGGVGGNGGVGARAHLGRAPREGIRGALGWGGGGGGAAAGAWCLASRSSSCDAAPRPTHMDVASAHHHTHRRAPVIGGRWPRRQRRLSMHASGHGMRTSVAGGTVSSAAVVVPSSSGPSDDGADTTASPRVGKVADGEFRALCDPAPDYARADSGRATPSATRRARPEN